MSVSTIFKGSQIDPALIPAAPGADSINGLTGAITLAAGAGISIPAPVGQNITVTNSGVTSLDTLTGDVTFSAGTGIGIAQGLGPVIGINVNCDTVAQSGVLRQADNTITPIGVANQLIAPYTGPYLVRTTILAVAGGPTAFSWNQGVDSIISTVLINAGVPQDPANENTLAACVATPATPVSLGSFYNLTNIIYANQGQVISAAIGSTGAPNLGTGGGVGVVITPLFA